MPISFFWTSPILFPVCVFTFFIISIISNLVFAKINSINIKTALKKYVWISWLITFVAHILESSIFFLLSASMYDVYGFGYLNYALSQLVNGDYYAQPLSFLFILTIFILIVYLSYLIYKHVIFKKTKYSKFSIVVLSIMSSPILYFIPSMYGVS